MSDTTEELRDEFLRRQAAGEPMPANAPRCAPNVSYSAPGTMADEYPIDRDAKPDKQLGEIVRALAELIPGWEYQPAGEHDYSDWGQLTRADGAGVYFRNDSGRIEVAGEWPRAQNQGQMFSPNSYQATEYSRITVALKRSAEAIAADIERRFLPGYLSEYAQKVEQRDEYDRKTQAQTEITQRLAAIVGVEVRSGYNPYHPGEVADTFYGPTNCALRKCVVQYDGEAELEIRCDEATAAAILRLLIGPADAG
jgi:hypothetical protein